VKISRQRDSHLLVHGHPVLITGLGIDDVACPIITNTKYKTGWGCRVVNAGAVWEHRGPTVGEVELQGVDDAGFRFRAIVCPHLGDRWELGEHASERVEKTDDVGALLVAHDEEAVGHAEEVVGVEGVEVDVGAGAGGGVAEAAAAARLWRWIAYRTPATGPEAGI
jgi:hypothetical protein